MKNRKILKIMVMLISLLTANLITTYIDEFFLSYKREFSRAIFTLIGMAVVVAIYYPLFTKIDVWSGKFSEKFLRAGKSISGKKTGIYIAFLLAIALLFYLYGRMWFKTNLFSDIYPF